MELNVHRAATCHPRADARIALLLWHLAERWGRVEPDGILVPLPLTHRLIGRLVGAERPSVSHALARLSDAGLVTREDRGLVLHGTAAHHIACARRPSRTVGCTDERRPSSPPRQAADRAAPVHVLWMTSGLGCDGDTVAMTAATQPSLEDLLTRALPGMPGVALYNPFLAVESGEDFMQAWYDAEAGRLDPFILVLEGAVPNERINGDGHWAALGTDPATGQPITTNEWIDRLAPRAAIVLALGTCAAYGGDPGDAEQPDRRDGPARLPRPRLALAARPSRS